MQMRWITAVVAGAAAAGLLYTVAREPAPPAAETRIAVDSTNNELLITVGPIDLPAPAGEPGDAVHAAHDATSDSAAMESEGHHGSAVFPPIGTVEVPIDVYLSGFSWEVVDAQGNPLPSELLHHVNLINASKRELFLPISQRLLALGNETRDKSVPARLMGVPLSTGTRIVVAAMMHNPTGVARHGVELRIRLKYRSAAGFEPRFAVQPFQMDVSFPAGDKSVDLPPGRSEWSWEGSPAVAGQILVVGGHMHKYSEAIRLEDVTEGRVVWEGKPIYDEEGNLTDVTMGRLYQQTSGARLLPEHTYRVTVVYHNPTPDTLIEGGMGVVAGVFYPEPSAVWPDADPTNQLYIVDRMHYMREVRGKYEEIVRLANGRRAGR